MKVFVVHNSYLERGGEDEVVESEINLLEKYGHKVITYRRSNKEIENLSFLKKIDLLKRKIIWSEDTYREIKALIRKEKPDVAHIHNIFLLISPSVYYALSEENIPIVQTLHNYRLICPKSIFYRDDNVCENCKGQNFMPSIIHKCWRNSLFLTFALARALSIHFKRRTFQDKVDAYIVMSKFSVDKFIDAGLPAKKIFIKPNFIETDTERRCNFDNFILFVGRLADYKGIAILIEAFRRLKDYKLKIIGDGCLFGRLKKEVKKMGNVELLGRLPHDRIVEYMMGSSFLVFPSECYENTPRAVVEALAYSTPVLVSDRGFKGENIQEKGAGLLFKARDINDFTLKIRYMMENKKLLEHMKEGAFKLYKENYTPEINYGILMNIYEALISS